ncbi:MAG: N-(5'-phosphoribosyl)anthranilate isomerase [Phycisphaerae bacterium]|nr:N-(5'-phosphoribosyl)anthranilate isomerase [Phycisphaerae bacterium]
MEIKICGITRPRDAALAAELGVDHIGMIFAPSARRIDLSAARAIVAGLPPTTRPVLVFRDAPVDEVVAAVDAVGVAHVQLHGDESVDALAALAAALPAVRIIKAWEVRSAESGAALRRYVDDLASRSVRLHRVILDLPKSGSAPPAGAFAQIARAWPASYPGLWRAGGLDDANVSEALREACYAGVDVARGVEHSAGVKDEGRLRRLVEAVRRGA